MLVLQADLYTTLRNPTPFLRERLDGSEWKAKNIKRMQGNKKKY